jgi:opacity protein-like surface antigen
MRKTTGFILFLILLGATAATAQSYPKMTFYGGYAHGLQHRNAGTFNDSEGGDTFSFEPCAADSADILGPHLQHAVCGRHDARGFDASIKYNLSQRLGLRADVSSLSGRTSAVDTFGDGADAHTDTNTIRDRTTLALVGFELGNNSAARWRPFVHLLAGVARQTSTDSQTSTGPFVFSIRDSVTSFAMKIGGGIDLPVSQHLDIRLIEADYVPIFAGSRHQPGNADFDQTVGGKTANNITFGFGIVLH